jgi:Thioredoxin like C-terminal domain
VLDTPQVYAVPGRLRLNQWALAGDWTVKRQAITLNAPDGGSSTGFTPATCTCHGTGHAGHAGPVPGAAGRAAASSRPRHRCRRGGRRHGHSPRLYQLIRQPGPITERTFEITFLDPDVQAYAFTFG